MAKDTFYFSHDYNSRNDEKIKKLIRKHNMVGYGIFWSIVEDLYNNNNELNLDFEGIAFDLRVEVEVVKSIITEFDLFLIDDNYFGSLSIEKRLTERNGKSQKARDSARRRWENQKNKCERNANALKNDATAILTECEGNAIKEIKGKELKEINTPIGVVATPAIPVIEKINDKAEWNEFVRGFESLGNDLPEKNKHTIQRTELKKFIEEKKPQYPEPYFTAYRLFSLKEGLSIPETLSESRKKKFKVRIKEPPFDFYKILEGIHNSKFCRGDNNRSWKIDWDWIFENDSNYIKIIENKFD